MILAAKRTDMAGIQMTLGAQAFTALVGCIPKASASFPPLKISPSTHLPGGNENDGTAGCQGEDRFRLLCARFNVLRGLHTLFAGKVRDKR